MTEFASGRIPNVLVDWAVRSHFPPDTISMVESASVPKDSVPFFDWLVAAVKDLSPEADPVVLKQRLANAEAELESIDDKIEDMGRKLKGLMEKPVHESLSDEIDDLKICMYTISSENFEEKNEQTKAAVQNLLRQEAVLTSHICEIEEQQEEESGTGDTVAASIEVAEKLAEFERYRKLHQSVYNIRLCVEVAAAKSIVAAEFNNNLSKRVSNVNSCTQDFSSNATLVRNDLTRLKKKLIDLENDRLKYELLQEKAALMQSVGCGIQISKAAKQKMAADAMLQQEVRYSNAISIIKKELKSTMSANMKFAQCSEFVDRAV